MTKEPKELIPTQISEKQEYIDFSNAAFKGVDELYDGKPSIVIPNIKFNMYMLNPTCNVIDLEDYTMTRWILTKKAGQSFENPAEIDFEAERLFTKKLDLSKDFDRRLFEYLLFNIQCSFSYWRIHKDSDLPWAKFGLHARTGKIQSNPSQIEVNILSEDALLAKKIESRKVRLHLETMAMGLTHHELQQLIPDGGKSLTENECLEEVLLRIAQGRITAASFSNSKVDATAATSKAKKKITESGEAATTTGKKTTSRSRTKQELPGGED